jgi:hypothetical protein
LPEDSADAPPPPLKLGEIEEFAPIKIHTDGPIVPSTIST